jgi:hypothetical protein
MTFADFEEKIRDELDRMLGPYGRVAIANSDSAGDAYIHLAIDQAGARRRSLWDEYSNGRTPRHVAPS